MCVKMMLKIIKKKATPDMKQGQNKPFSFLKCADKTWQQKKNGRAWRERPKEKRNNRKIIHAAIYI